MEDIVNKIHSLLYSKLTMDVPVLSGNMSMSISENGMEIIIDAPFYDMKRWLKDGTIIHTGRVIDGDYPKWTLTLIGDEFATDEDLKEDKIINIHNGLYFTYLFEEEGVYKIKLELMDINDNKYEIEKSIVIVDKDANYEMYHTLKDEYDKYLEAKKERSLAYI